MKTPFTHAAMALVLCLAATFTASAAWAQSGLPHAPDGLKPHPSTLPPELRATQQQAVAPEAAPSPAPSPSPAPAPSPAPVAPVDKAETTTKADTPAKDAYTINPGDVLQVTVWREEGLDREIVVLPDGKIDFPLIGSVNVKGKTPSEAQDLIKSKISHYIPDASVAVVIKAALGHAVNVIGQVNKPGNVIMGRRMTVMQALSEAGGLTPYASQSGIKILRQTDKGETSIPFPYDDVADGDDLDKDIVLIPGDVIVVPTSSLLRFW